MPKLSAVWKIAGGLGVLLDQMLLVDYGIGVYPESWCPWFPSWLLRRWVRPEVDDFCKYLAEFVHCCRHGQLPEEDAWRRLGCVLRTFDLPAGSDVSDVAIMLYNYHTHRRQVDPMEWKKGVTSCIGIMHELKDEVPTRGPVRLMRKLSVDINYTIRSRVFDPERRKTAIAIAEAIAAQYNPVVVSPMVNFAGFLKQEQKSQQEPPPYSPTTPIMENAASSSKD